MRARFFARDSTSPADAFVSALPSKTRGESGLRAASMPTTKGRAAYATTIAARASSAWSAVSAATAAISCPAKRVFSPGSASGRTARTPGIRRAAERSTEVTVAAARGHRRIRAYSIPGRRMSIEYFASPVALAFPSTRGTRLPRIEYFRDGSQGTGSPGATTISLTWKSPPKPTRILSVMSGLLLFHDVEDRLGDARVVAS